MIRLRLGMLTLVVAIACGSIKEELEAGQKFGATNDLEACLSESLSRLNACDSVSCEALSPGFARGCAKSARYSERLCSRVPKSILQAASWIEDQCESHTNPKACYKVYQQPVTRCLDAAT